MVEHALLFGSTVPCPDCGTSIEKSDACIHMGPCPNCRSNFCYVCGGGLADCPRGAGGCDDPTCFMESHPDWRRFGGTKACLVEFHRRRTASMLQLAHHLLGEERWAELRDQRPALLVTNLFGAPISFSWEEAQHPRVLMPTVGGSEAHKARRVMAQLEAAHAKLAPLLPEADRVDLVSRWRQEAADEAMARQLAEEEEERRRVQQEEERERRRQQEEGERRRRQQEAEELRRRQEEEERRRRQEAEERRRRRQEEERRRRQEEEERRQLLPPPLALWKAAAAGDAPEVRRLLAAGADKDEVRSLPANVGEGVCCCCFAAGAARGRCGCGVFFFLVVVAVAAAARCVWCVSCRCGLPVPGGRPPQPPRVFSGDSGGQRGAAGAKAEVLGSIPGASWRCWW